jgi:hypothetical protein
LRGRGGWGVKLLNAFVLFCSCQENEGGFKGLRQIELDIDAMLNFSERRKATRFKGKIPIELRNGTGVTRDFSTSGVYFETDQSFAPAEPIEFFMDLEHSGLAPLVRVRCLGEIVRVEAAGEKTGVAVAISSYSFEGLQQSSFEP